MRWAIITKTYRFEAAHRLPNHSGKCRRPHGHSYVVDLVLEGMIRGADGTSAEGMVCDFGDVSQAWLPLHGELDHHDLNDVIPENFQPTTAEHIAAYLLHRLGQPLPQLVAVRVHETATSIAEVRR